VYNIKVFMGFFFRLPNDGILDPSYEERVEGS